MLLRIFSGLIWFLGTSIPVLWSWLRNLADWISFVEGETVRKRVKGKKMTTGKLASKRLSSLINIYNALYRATQPPPTTTLGHNPGAVTKHT